MTFTIKDLERLKQAGLIRNYSIDPENKNTTTKIKTVKKSKIKEWIAIVIGKWCYVNKLELWHSGNEKGEYKFDKERKFRFDFCIPSIKLAIEYEGIFSAKSRHTSLKGYSIDAEKYNLAASQGWTVLRYTASNYKQLENDLGKISIEL